jgi:hypothetical protein
MVKVGQYVYFDLADFTVLEEIRSMCKMKNLSQTIHFVLGRYKKISDEQIKLRTLVQETINAPKIEHRKPVNPMVDL